MATKETYIIEQKITGDTSGLVKGLGTAEKSLDDLSSGVNRAKARITDFLSPANLVAGAMAYASYRTVQAVKDFAAYEKQLSSLNTLLKVSKTELNTYGEGFVDLAIKLGASKEDIASGAYEALSAGVESSDLLTFMDVATKGAAAGMTSVATSVDVLTSTLNGFNLESSQATVVMDKLITIQNNGKVKLEELSRVMGNVAGISYTMGVSLDEVGAAIATITMNGTPAAEAGTRLRAMFTELAKESTDVSKIFKKLTGSTFKDFISQGGSMSEALALLNEHAEKNNKSMIDLWSSIEAGQGALGLTGSNVSRFNDALDKMNNSAGELEKSYKIASDNIETEWKKLTALINSKWLETVVALEEPIKVLIQVAYEIIETVDFINNTKKILGFLDTATGFAEPVKAATKRVAKDYLNQKQMTRDAAAAAKEAKYGGTAVVSDIETQRAEQRSTGSINWTDRDAIAAKKKAIAAAAEEEARLKAEAEAKAAIDAKSAEDKAAHLKKISDYEATYRDKLVVIDSENLSNKSQYYSDIQQQLLDGTISKEKYNELMDEYDKEAQTNSNESYKEALKELQDFYKSIGELAKANDIGKQILEIEVQAKVDYGEGLMVEDPDLAAFREQQELDQKIFHNQTLLNEMEFQEQLRDLKIQKGLSDEEEAQRILDYKTNQQVLDQQFKISQLEDQRDFYLTMDDMALQSYETQQKINQMKQNMNTAQQNHADLSTKMEEWAARKRVDIVAWSADALLDTYTMLATGQIKDLAGFKVYLKEKLGELLLAKGEEHAAIAISDTGKAISALATPGMQWAAPGLFWSAAENAAKAALFGVAANAVTGGSSSSDETDYDSESSYSSSSDDDISSAEDTATEAAEEKTRIYVSTAENAMASAMVKLIEKELNDEYNVSIIAEK